MNTEKHALRRYFRALRNAFQGEERAHAERALNAHLLRVLKEIGKRENGGCIALYLALRGEANVDETLRVLRERGECVAAPADFNEPRFGMISGMGNLRMEKSGARFPPMNAPEIAPQHLRAIVVPALAFDGSGNRLGQGGGWYDRVLSVAPQALKIGVAFDFQISATPLPCEPHDIAMDVLITPTRIIWLRDL